MRLPKKKRNHATGPERLKLKAGGSRESADLFSSREMEKAAVSGVLR